MRTVQELYDAYRIMPSLQLHQLRVAAVGKLICEHFSGDIDTNSVILACLLHDMGNIIKSDLTTFPDFVEPEGYDYWKQIKDEWHAKYGDDEHRATIAIVKESGLPETVIGLISHVGFSQLKDARDSHSYEQKIVDYADSRVGPYGILSLRDRQEEARVRYQHIDHPDMPNSREAYDEVVAATDEIERQIFARCSLRPEDLSDAAAAPLIGELRNFPVA